MKKRILALLCAVILACGPVTLAAGVQTQSVNVVLDGRAVEFTDETGYPYVDENFRTMVPLRVTMESAGFTVDYDNATQTALVLAGQSRIAVPIGTNLIYKDGVKIENDTVAAAKNGRTYLPIRAVLEAAGYKVDYDTATRSVVAYSGGSAGTEGSSGETAGESASYVLLSGTEVWIPTHGGTKYHSNASCSNMIDPIAVDLNEAVAQGFTACKRCH